MGGVHSSRTFNEIIARYATKTPEKVISFLQKNSYDVNAIVQEGNTILMAMAYHDMLETIKRLIPTYRMHNHCNDYGKNLYYILVERNPSTIITEFYDYFNSGNANVLLSIRRKSPINFQYGIREAIQYRMDLSFMLYNLSGYSHYDDRVAQINIIRSGLYDPYYVHDNKDAFTLTQKVLNNRY